ncbi:MAG: 3-phosphoserine/phosphohydroxythreonine transaminase [Thermodesulfobacteriota bacterium]|nr:3-phosphoserine/phosphohydroxythreonine transaminase [Thermodesulfobacteriota bacterium]
MSRNIYIFNAGPAVLPEPVLQSTSEAMLDFAGTGMSIMEISHRSKEFDALIDNTIDRLKKTMGIPDGYKVLFLQGGASLQFAMVPLNLLKKDRSADYVDTGSWSTKAIKEAKKIGHVNVVASSKDRGYTYIPDISQIQTSPDAAYCHITSNNTIYGTQWQEFPNTRTTPLIADMSSDILSRAIDVSAFGIIYAGAQKNMGPSGVTTVIIRDDLVEKAQENTLTMLDYKTHADKNSMFNTCPVTSIFVVHEVLKWIEDQGGVQAIEKTNKAKAAYIYDILDSSAFYRGTVEKASRSRMNITMRLPDEDLEKQFIAQASEQGMFGLKGHRSVGGIRASMYNAMPIEGAQKLAEFMRTFEKKH